MSTRVSTVPMAPWWLSFRVGHCGTCPSGVFRSVAQRFLSLRLCALSEPNEPMPELFRVCLLACPEATRRKQDLHGADPMEGVAGATGRWTEATAAQANLSRGTCRILSSSIGHQGQHGGLRFQITVAA